MSDKERRTLWFAYGKMAFWTVVLLYVGATIVYAVATGQALFTNIRYNTAGRVEQAVFGVVATAYAIHTVLRMRRMKKGWDEHSRD